MLRKPASGWFVVLWTSAVVSGHDYAYHDHRPVVCVVSLVLLFCAVCEAWSKPR